LPHLSTEPNELLEAAARLSVVIEKAVPELLRTDAGVFSSYRLAFRNRERGVDASTRCPAGAQAAGDALAYSARTIFGG
jgi:hypothetical protein